MWGIFGKPLKRAIWNIRLACCTSNVFEIFFPSVLDGACVACCLFCHQAATMSAYKFTSRVFASLDAPQKPLVRKGARSGVHTDGCCSEFLNWPFVIYMTNWCDGTGSITLRGVSSSKDTPILCAMQCHAPWTVCCAMLTIIMV